MAANDQPRRPLHRSWVALDHASGGQAQRHSAWCLPDRWLNSSVIRNILFDWSGTLVDDLPAVWKATNHVLQKAGRDELTLECFRAEFCLPFKKFYDRYTPNLPMAQLEEWFHGHFRQAQDSIVEIRHARSFLDSCQARNIRMFVLSTMHPEHYSAQGAVTGFERYFERAYVGVVDKQARIVELLEENRLIPNETLFVGDMQHDIETARHGGVFSVAVLTGYTGLKQLQESNPDLIVEHLGELQSILDENGWAVQPGQAIGGLPRQPCPPSRSAG